MALFSAIFSFRYYASLSCFQAHADGCLVFPADLSCSCMRELCTMLVIRFDVINFLVQQFLFRFSAFGQYLLFSVYHCHVCVARFIHHIHSLIIHALFLRYPVTIGDWLSCCLCVLLIRFIRIIKNVYCEIHQST